MLQTTTHQAAKAALAHCTGCTLPSHIVPAGRFMQRKASHGLLMGTPICCQDHSLAKAVQAENHHSVPKGHHVLRGCNVLRGCQILMHRGCSALGAFTPLCRSHAPCGRLPCLGSCLLRGVRSCRQCQRPSDATSLLLSPPLIPCLPAHLHGQLPGRIPVQAAP